LDLAGIVVACLSALGTLVQAFYAVKNTNGKVAESKLKQAEKQASEPLKVGAKKVDDVIDHFLLATLCDELERHNSNLVEAFRTNNMSQVDTAIKVENARAQICKVLSEIMRF